MVLFHPLIIDSSHSTLHIALSVYNIWAKHRHAEHIYVILSKTVPLVVTGVTLGLEYTPALQGSWTAYMVVANIQAVGSCALSILLIVMVLWKYFNKRKLWKSVQTGSTSSTSRNSVTSWKPWTLNKRASQNPSLISAEALQSSDHSVHPNLDKWLVIRLLIAIVFIS